MNINSYITYDLPVPYKNLLFYPVNLKEYSLFLTYSQCLTFIKNDIPDVKIISMNDLEFIFYSATNGKEGDLPYLLLFDRLLSLCLKDDTSFENIEESLKRYGYDENRKPFFVIGGEKYNNEDFEKIRYIISEQNSLELPDKMISKEVRDSLEKAQEYKEKHSGQKPGSLEDYIISLATATGWSFEYIYSLTIRKFIKSVKRMDNLIHYKIFLNASLTGFTELKDKSVIKHWLSDIEEDEKYKDVSLDLNEVENKISMDEAKERESQKYNE
jgi:hypothetical protein